MTAMLALPAVLLTSCGGDDGGPAKPGDEADQASLEDVVVLEGDRVEVDALDNTFNDQNIQVAAGTTVVWDNKGRQDHDVVPVDEDGWGVSEQDFAPGDVYEHTFDEAGTYRYYCSLHGDMDAGMIGAVVVEEPSSTREGHDDDS